LLQLGFLSPKIVEEIAAGHQPLDLTVIGLTRRIDLSLLWSAQQQVLGMRKFTPVWISTVDKMACSAAASSVKFPAIPRSVGGCMLLRAGSFT